MSLRVEPYPNEQGRFRVYSDSGEVYNVDLAYRGEHGKEKSRPECDCIGFRCKKTKFCKHIIACMDLELDRIGKG